MQARSSTQASAKLGRGGGGMQEEHFKVSCRRRARDRSRRRALSLAPASHTPAAGCSPAQANSQVNHNQEQPGGTCQVGQARCIRCITPDASRLVAHAADLREVDVAGVPSSGQIILSISWFSSA